MTGKQLGRPNGVHGILVACMPKSGSTYLSSLIAALPGFQRKHGVPSYERREQELDEAKIADAFTETVTLRKAFAAGLLVSQDRPRGFVMQHHVRHSKETERLIEQFELVPVVLVRSLFDIVVSLSDHLMRDASEGGGVFMSMAYADERVREWAPEQRSAFIVDLAIPWFVNFYVGWHRRPNTLFVSYDELTADPADVLRRVLEAGHISRNREMYQSAIETVAGGFTRRNVGVGGRGADLPEELKERVRHCCTYYEDVDFGPIGISSHG